ncbi:AAA family ATPase [Shinella granuli]|uniref:Uncharacterized protein DUF4435 n=1 Tax=Shinella granuli TaxID=323621 RepID=A0A4R2CQ86_SHIGR|nr:AAA family ATPase [Shinella granuli]TCN42282.1 uncharacterized protein DUF4435 [Shinella granuli]
MNGSNFFGEFQIQLHGPAKNLKGLFNNPNKRIEIECDFQLRNREREYILENCRELLEETIWHGVLPEAFQWGGYRKASFSTQFRDRQPEVDEKMEEKLPELLREVESSFVTGGIRIDESGHVDVMPSILLELAFSNYRPRHIGVVDFHGAQRHYGRELVQGINLNLDQQNQNYSQHALYNYNNKYANVKSEMAGNYIKELLSEKASSEKCSQDHTLTEALKNLFSTFFPDKEFLGPQPTADGSLSFPVRTASGSIHDLDELSSGEKEILYGYLRIRSSAPANSIILLDEPELHLNPRLIRGLPEFYREHLGETLSNQLWLVTHSDSLIREAMGKAGFNIFHMLPSTAENVEQSQLKSMSATGDLELALADLVGDLAAYRPGGKCVILEGGGDTDFDKTLLQRLFPDELRGINLVSGSNKNKVTSLHEILGRAYREGSLSTKFYAITDMDSDEVDIQAEGVGKFSWDVYHIENYLLDEEVISYVVNSMLDKPKFSVEHVLNELKKSAAEVLPGVITHRLRVHLGGLLIRSINLSFDPKIFDISEAFYEIIQMSSEKISRVVSSEATLDRIKEEQERISKDFDGIFSDNSWRSKIPGREILKRYFSSCGISANYNLFRNLVVNRMAELSRKPLGMASVLEKIAKD